jgi:hypothetical protein
VPCAELRHIGLAHVPIEQRRRGSPPVHAPVHVGLSVKPQQPVDRKQFLKRRLAGLQHPALRLVEQSPNGELLLNRFGVHSPVLLYKTDCSQNVSTGSKTDENHMAGRTFFEL